MSTQLHDQHLRHHHDVLKSIRQHGGGMSALETALRVRKTLRSDTLAPNWLRDYADETVQITQEEIYGTLPDPDGATFWPPDERDPA